MEVEKFTHDEKDYEIRIISDGELVYVKAFCDNKPANRFRYSVTMDEIHDMATAIKQDAVKHLIEIARQDVIKGLK